MDEKTIIGLLKEIEKKFPVDKWVIDDIHIWPIIRIDLRFNLYFLSKGSNYTNNLSFANKIRYGSKILILNIKFIYAYLCDTKHNDKPKKCEVVFLTDTDLRTYLDGAWYDRLCGPFIEYFKRTGVRSFVMEKSQRYHIPRHSSTMFIQPYLDAATVNIALSNIKIEDTNYQLQKYDEFVNFITLKNLAIPLPSYKRINLVVALIKKYRKFFNVLLLQIKPKIAFLTSYQNPVGMAFNLACKDLGVKSIEIQHGVQGNYNAAYGQWNKVPKSGYELLPAVFWCWSDYEALAIKRWSNKVSKWHKPLVGGNLFLESYNSTFSFSNKEFEKYVVQKKDIGKVNILLSLSMVNNDSNFKEVFAVMKKSPKSWKWWLRVHPCSLQSKDEIIEILEKNGVKDYDIDLPSKLPLFTILNWMKLHITYDSAVTIDASYMNIPTLVTSRDAWVYFPRQIKSKLVYLAYTKGEIMSLIKMLSKAQPGKKNVKPNNYSQAYNYLSYLLNNKSTNN